MKLVKNQKIAEVIVSVLTVIVSYLIFNLIPIEKLNIQNRYTMDFLAELSWAIIILICILLLRKMKIYKFDINGLKEGWTSGLPLITIISLVIIEIVFTYSPITANKFEVLLFILQMFLVGFCEESLFRGLIQNSLHNLFNENKVSQVRIAIIVSGLLFGCMHLANAVSIGFLAALYQSVAASAVGMMMGAIYYRTNKNLWYNMILHSMNDAFIIMLYGGLSGISIETILEDSYSFDIATLLVPVIIYGTITRVLLRKKKIQPLLKPYSDKV